MRKIVPVLSSCQTVFYTNNSDNQAILEEIANGYEIIIWDNKALNLILYMWYNVRIANPYRRHLLRHIYSKPTFIQNPQSSMAVYTATLLSGLSIYIYAYMCVLLTHFSLCVHVCVSVYRSVTSVENQGRRSNTADNKPKTGMDETTFKGRKWSGHSEYEPYQGRKTRPPTLIGLIRPQLHI